jgi:hypothetical protein
MIVKSVSKGTPKKFPSENKAKKRTVNPETPIMKIRLLL